MNLELSRFILNGGYLYACCLYFYIISQNVKLSIYIFLKAFSANYYFMFCKFYKNPNIMIFKHMTRLTDSGHFVNGLFYLYPEKFTGLAHNVLFVITFAYYGCAIGLKMRDTDILKNKEIIRWMHDFQSHVNHIVPYSIVLYDLITIKNDQCFFVN